MKANKTAIKWTGQIAFYLLLIILIISFNTNINDSSIKVWYDMAMACFGSAVLGLIIAVSNYFAERQSSMECFYEESARIYNMIANMPDMGIISEQEAELVIEYVTKSDDIVETDRITKLLKNMYYLDGGITEEATYSHCKKTKEKRMALSDEKRKAYVEQKISRLSEINDQIIETAKIMIELRTFDFSALHHSYGKLDYFIPAKLYFITQDIYSTFNHMKEYCLEHQKELQEFDRTKEIKNCIEHVIVFNYVFFHPYFPSSFFIKSKKDTISYLHMIMDIFNEKIVTNPSNIIFNLMAKNVISKTTHPENIGAKGIGALECKVKDIRNKQIE